MCWICKDLQITSNLRFIPKISRKIFWRNNDLVKIIFNQGISLWLIYIYNSFLRINVDRFRAILVTHLHPQGETSRLPIRPFRSPASRIPQSFPGETPAWELTRVVQNVVHQLLSGILLVSCRMQVLPLNHTKSEGSRTNPGSFQANPAHSRVVEPDLFAHQVSPAEMTGGRPWEALGGLGRA